MKDSIWYKKLQELKFQLRKKLSGTDFISKKNNIILCTEFRHSTADHIFHPSLPRAPPAWHVRWRSAQLPRPAPQVRNRLLDGHSRQVGNRLLHGHSRQVCNRLLHGHSRQVRNRLLTDTVGRYATVYSTDSVDRYATVYSTDTVDRCATVYSTDTVTGT